MSIFRPFVEDNVNKHMNETVHVVDVHDMGKYVVVDTEQYGPLGVTWAGASEYLRKMIGDGRKDFFAVFSKKRNENNTEYGHIEVLGTASQTCGCASKCDCDAPARHGVSGLEKLMTEFHESMEMVEDARGKGLSIDREFFIDAIERKVLVQAYMMGYEDASRGVVSNG